MSDANASLRSAPSSMIRSRTGARPDKDLTAPDMIAFTVPCPPSANKYWRPLIIKGRAVIGVTNEANKYKRALKAQFANWEYFLYPKTQNLHVEMVVFLPSLRGDVHNIPKILLDALQGLVIEDDKCVTSLNIRLGGVIKDNPVVEVKIETL